jgi:hypothetical protein
MDSNLGFPNPRNLPYKGSHQIVQQNIGGLNTSPASTYAKRFTYPLWVASTYDAPLAGGLMIDATLRRGKTVEQIGELAFRNAGILAAPLDAAFRGSNEQICRTARLPTSTFLRKRDRTVLAARSSTIRLVAFGNVPKVRSSMTKCSIDGS